MCWMFCKQHSRKMKRIYNLWTQWTEWTLWISSIVLLNLFRIWLRPLTQAVVRRGLPVNLTGQIVCNENSNDDTVSIIYGKKTVIMFLNINPKVN